MVAGQVGSYHVVRELGKGGMGAVYLGEHPLIGKKVAIKVLLPELSGNHAQVARFFNEARASSMVSHPGIVEAFDFGYLADGSAYIVMEFLEGESLGTRLRRLRQLPEQHAALIARQAAGALAAAHASGIVHRDFKPDNVFLVPDPEIAGGERVKVLDFGIAKLAGDTAGGTRTRTGSMMGSPAYMAPEQCRGAGQVDLRADVYSLGCVLYEMCCGRLPFDADGIGEIIAMHIYEAPPPPRAVAPSMSPGMEALILRALAKNPDDRQANMAQVIGELDAVTEGRLVVAATPPGGVTAVGASGPLWAVSPPPAVGAVASVTTLGGAAAEMTAPEARPARRGPWAAAAIAAAVVGGGIAYWVAGRAPPAREDRATQGAPAPAEAASTPRPAAAVDGRAPEPARAAGERAPEPAPARVRAAVDSVPPGAAVYRVSDGVRLGTTPFAREFDRSDGEIALVLKLAGFQDAPVALPASRDASETVTLERKRSRSSRTSRDREPDAEPPAAKRRTKGALVDPYE
jgi:serine/threonine-protein kinase